jgi:hypothetical protein
MLCYLCVPLSFRVQLHLDPECDVGTPSTYDMAKSQKLELNFRYYETVRTRLYDVSVTKLKLNI